MASLLDYLRIWGIESQFLALLIAPLPQLHMPISHSSPAAERLSSLNRHFIGLPLIS